MEQTLQLTKPPVQPVSSSSNSNSKNAAFQVNFISFSLQCTWRRKKFISHFTDAFKICLSLPYSLVAFFLEKTPKALDFPYVAYCSLHSKFWRAWKRLSMYKPVFLKGLHLSVLKLTQNRLVHHSWNFFQQYLLLNQCNFESWLTAP